MGKYYTSSYELIQEINFLKRKIDDIGKENIINHHLAEEVENNINSIAIKIENTNRRNRYSPIIKNIKIFGRALQGVFPYAIITGAIFGLQALIYDVPFIRQDQYKIAAHNEIIDINGLICDKVNYVVSSTSLNNSAYYSTNWEKRDDGKYYRTVKEYTVKYRDVEELKELINNPDMTFDDVFGKPETKYEIKTEEEITENDLKEGKGYKIVYRYLDDEDFIVEIQDVGPNIGFSVVYILFTALCLIPIAIIRDKESKFNFREHFYSLQQKYQKVDLTEAIKLFEEGKIKFYRVQHRQVQLTDPITNEKTYLKA